MYFSDCYGPFFPDLSLYTSRAIFISRYTGVLERPLFLHQSLFMILYHQSDETAF
jgi:hypothetical protein